MKTLLVLYENTGAGHRRAANLIGSMLADQADCRVITVAGSELFNDPSVDAINRLWIYLVRKHWVALADWLMNFHLRAWILPVIEASKLASYHNKLDELSPDAIICTADGFGKALGLYAQERGIPLYILVTEFSMFADLVNPMAMHICYFPETVNAIRSYRFEDAYFSLKLARDSSVLDKVRYILRIYKQHIQAGGARSIYRNIDTVHDEHNQARCVAIGPLVEPGYYEPLDKLAARKKLGIDRNRPCVLTISGSIGGDYLEEVIDAVEDGWQSSLTLLAVCGNDERAYQRLRARRRSSPAIEVRPLGFVENMAELYAAADVVVARPSASVILECMMRRVPIVIPQRTTANDLGGAEIIKKHGLGEVYRDRDDIIPSLRRVLEHPSDYKAALCRFLAPYPATYSELKETLVGIILGRDTQRFA